MPSYRRSSRLPKGSTASSSKRPGKNGTSSRLKDGSVPEKVIQKQILDWLKETGLLHWRQNSGIVFAGNRAIRLGESGLPDIVVIVPPGGRLVGLECKSANGRLRPDQITFQDRAKSAGAYYFVVRSLTQAMDAVASAVGRESFEALCSKGRR